MAKRGRSFGVVVVGGVIGLALATVGVGRAAPPCSDGEVRPCTLEKGCGGVQECAGGEWSACHCGGVAHVLGGEACESKCDGSQGTVVCDAECREVIGCGLEPCAACAEDNPGVRYCTLDGEMTSCLAAEVCNGCDDDQDGVVDNAPGDPNPDTLVAACNPNACEFAGSRTCANAKWSACTGCNGTGTCTVCGAQTDFDCKSGACEGPCARAEECNQCDDDADGTLDNGLHCAACSL